MKLSQALLSIISILLIGVVIGRISMVYDSGTEKPLSFAALSGMPQERSSPGDHIAEKDIHVYNDKVVLTLEEPFWASFTDTNSMDPIIDSKPNSIELKHGNADAHPYICHIVCRAYHRGAIKYLRQLDLPRDPLGSMNLLDRFAKVVKCS